MFFDHEKFLPIKPFPNSHRAGVEIGVVAWKSVKERFAVA